MLIDPECPAETTVRDSLSSTATPASSIGTQAGGPVALRARRFVGACLRRLWRMVPPRWAPLVHRSMMWTGAHLPCPLRARLGGLMYRLLGPTAAIEPDYHCWQSLFEETDEKAR